MQSVERAFDVLEIMAAAGGTIGLSQLADLSGLPVPTIYRLVRRSLVNCGYARQLPSRQYSLGPKLIRLGESATQLIGAWSRPHLAEVVKATGETANMAMLDEDTMAVYVYPGALPALDAHVHRGRSARVHALHRSGQGASHAAAQ